MKCYNKENVVFFWKTKAKNGEFSNMRRGFPISLNSYTFNSSESLYQALKFSYYPKIQELILNSKSPYESKVISRSYDSMVRSDWNEIRVSVMVWCLYAKWLAHKNRLVDLLKNTGNKPIVEFSLKNSFWGAMPDKTNSNLLIGQNVLGECLSGLRSVILNGNFPLSLKPLEIKDFLLFGDKIETINNGVNLNNFWC